MGTFEQSEAAKSELDQNLGVGVIKLLGLGLQAMRENKWVQCFFTPLTRSFPSCLVLVTAVQSSPRGGSCLNLDLQFFHTQNLQGGQVLPLSHLFYHSHPIQR